jgi:hypothetical protein
LQGQAQQGKRQNAQAASGKRQRLVYKLREKCTVMMFYGGSENTMMRASKLC